MGLTSIGRVSQYRHQRVNMVTRGIGWAVHSQYDYLFKVIYFSTCTQLQSKDWTCTYCVRCWYQSRQKGKCKQTQMAFVVSENWFFWCNRCVGKTDKRHDGTKGFPATRRQIHYTLWLLYSLCWLVLVPRLKGLWNKHVYVTENKDV